MTPQLTPGATYLVTHKAAYIKEPVIYFYHGKTELGYLFIGKCGSIYYGENRLNDNEYKKLSIAVRY